MSHVVKRRNNGKQLMSRIKWGEHVHCPDTDDAIEHRSHMVVTVDKDSYRIESVIASNGRRTFMTETNIYKMFGPNSWDHVSLRRTTPAKICKADIKDFFINYIMGTP